ncbi:MAG: hotdog domain-containing protein [Streptosporangiaceae bacterium]
MGDVFVPQLTMNLNVDYLRAVHAGVTYAVVGTTVHAGKTRTVSTATVADPDGNPCAMAHATTTGNLVFARNRKVSTGA